MPAAVRGNVRRRSDAQIKLGTERADYIAQVALTRPTRTWPHNLGEVEVCVPAEDTIGIGVRDAGVANRGGQARPEAFAFMGQ